jgi:hypothetical protein
MWVWQGQVAIEKAKSFGLLFLNVTPAGGSMVFAMSG